MRVQTFSTVKFTVLFREDRDTIEPPRPRPGPIQSVSKPTPTPTYNELFLSNHIQGGTRDLAPKETVPPILTLTPSNLQAQGNASDRTPELTMPTHSNALFSGIRRFLPRGFLTSKFSAPKPISLPETVPPRSAPPRQFSEPTSLLVQSPWETGRRLLHGANRPIFSPIVEPTELGLSLDRILGFCVALGCVLTFRVNTNPVEFRQYTLNAYYFHSMLVKEIQSLDKAEIAIEVDGMGRGQVLSKLKDCQEELEEGMYNNTCWNMLVSPITYHSPSPRLFIVLPSDLDSWNDTEPSTHQFRLYFLCDILTITKDGEKSKSLPQCVHLSSHQGYIIKQQQEFFHTYSDYVLKMLRIVKRGYTINELCGFGGGEVPPLDSFKLLWNFNAYTLGSQFTENSIGLAVDKAIEYLETLWPPKWSEFGLNRSQRGAVKNYLDIQDGENAEGQLHRYVDSVDRGRSMYDIERGVYWMCPQHHQQYFQPEPLQRLSKFVHGHAGYVDMQQATLRIDLGSKADADQFVALLTEAKYIFSITIKLCWKISRQCLEDLCRHIFKSKIILLEIDGVTLDIHPRDRTQHIGNLYSNGIVRSNNFTFLKLLNYPQPREQGLYMDRYELLLKYSPTRPDYDWLELRRSFTMFDCCVAETSTASDLLRASNELQLKLEKYGMSDVTTFALYDRHWNALFDLKKKAFVEVHSLHLDLPKEVVPFSGSLRIVTWNLSYLTFDHEFHRLVQANPELQELNISTEGFHIHSQAEHVARLWCDSPSLLRLTLLERREDGSSRIVVRLEVGGSSKRRSRGVIRKICGANNLSDLNGQQGLGVPAANEFVQWGCEHVFSPLSDFSALFLDMATQHHPSVLISFTLDISQISLSGLVFVQNVLGKSSLDTLHVVCTSLEPMLSHPIAQLLRSVQWSTLKSLVLSGDNINGWLKIWSLDDTPRLLRLEMHGSRSILQELSHSNVLTVAHLVYTSQIEDLHLENVQLQDKRDWALIVESMDSSSLATFRLCKSSAGQFMSAAIAVDTFFSRFENGKQEGRDAKLILASFTIDEVLIAQSGLSCILDVLCRSRVDQVRINCNTLSSSTSNTFARVIGSLPWSSVKSLVLSGDNINGWIPLLAGVTIPQLQRLHIYGTGATPEVMVYASTLFILHLIDMSQLLGLKFRNVQMYYKGDWVLIIESIDRLVFCAFDLDTICNRQFMSVPNAVDFYQTKLKSMRE